MAKNKDSPKSKADLNESLLKGMSILQKLAAARQACKSRETDLIKERKGLELQIEELGTSQGGEFQKYAADFYLTQRRIDFERNRQKQLADMMEKTIGDSVQGTFEFDDVDERELIKAPNDADLFHKDEPEQGDESQMKLPGAGKPGRVKPEAPDPSKGDGVDEHLNVDVKELDIANPALIEKLVAAGLTKVGHLARIIDADADDLVEGAKLSVSQVKTVHASVKRYRNLHRTAAREVESAGV
jgi:hypothetical protein